VPTDVAYLLFTSGSTGAPKGVPVTHANVLHFIDVVTRRYGVTEYDRFSQTFDQTFDLSVFDLFVAWESGACVCTPQPIDLLAPVQFIRKHQVSVWFSVPSVAALMRKKKVLKPNSMPTLRWSLFCGEPLPRASAEEWQAAAPNSILENLYGPTELTIACFVHRWDSQRSPQLCVNDVVPIGRPLEGLGAVLLGEQLEPPATNGAGELCVCGPQTVPGYWKDASKSAERFVTLPATDSSEMRFYRTGDRVMQLAGGEYAFLGRMDDQIKVLGHRVELGEVESALRQDPRVAEAVAVGWPEESGTAEGVVAFVSGSQLDPEQLKKAASELLPDYMAPRQIFLVDALPLNGNGKVDRGAIRRQLETTASARR
jgi:amino acid adenylation domain-containing protein